MIKDFTFHGFHQIVKFIRKSTNIFLVKYWYIKRQHPDKMVDVLDNTQGLIFLNCLIDEVVKIGLRVPSYQVEWWDIKEWSS